MNERILKRSLLDRYFSSFQEILSTPFSYNKCSPYRNSNGTLNSSSKNTKAIERQESEKLIFEISDESDDLSLTSRDSRSQLPKIKHKHKTKAVGLPYQIEINRNKKLLKAKKVHTASNWFPTVQISQKNEEKPAVVRPSTSNGSNKRSQSKKNFSYIQSLNEIKPDVPNSSRILKSKRIVMKNNAKTANKNNPKSESANEGIGNNNLAKKNRKKDYFYNIQEIEIPGEEECSDVFDKNSTEKISKVEISEKFKQESRLKPGDTKEKYEKKSGSAKNYEKGSEKSEKTLEKPEKNIEKPEKNLEKPSEKLKKPKPAPPSVSEIINKHRNSNLNQLLNNKNSDFKSLMQEYLRRQGLPESSKVFILTGQYEFLRKILTSQGWIENTHQSSQAFDLKWTYNDSEADYKFLRLGQYYNHFPNNRELTTKSGLHKNLRSVTDYGTNIDEFYPRTYDLGDAVQVLEFSKDYFRTSIFNVITKFAKMFKTGIQTPVDVEVLNLAIKVAEKDLKTFLDNCEKVEPEWEYSDNIIKQIVEFSESCHKDIQDHWDYPDENLIKATVFLSELIETTFPQKRMEGTKNIWIVKPGLNARGSGVKCMQGLNNILEYGAQLTARIVQKYVESPLLINSNKFDIRQWVLVTNYEPLTVYFFNNCYLRLCQLPFNLESLEAFRHLANYSLQKNIAKNQEETVWSLDKFLAFLLKFNEPWEKILKKIHFLVIKTLLAVKENIESRPECFELYGFDIIIDEYFSPWLLEVNLSPACAERTDWLSEMLTEMGKGLLSIIFENKTKSPLYSHDMALLGNLMGNTNEWIFLYKSQEFPQGDLENIIYTQLEVYGEKVNFKKEKIFDKKFLMASSVNTIQKHVRGFLVRKKIIRDRENYESLAIQKVFRRKLAWDKLDKQIRLVACIRIQKAFRGFLARKLLHRLKTFFCAKIVQAHLKGFYQRHAFKTAKAKKAVTWVQQFIRVKISEERLRIKKKFLVSLRKIQVFWKFRWENLNSKAKKIQKHWKLYFAKKLKKYLLIQRYIQAFLSKKKLELKKAKKKKKTFVKLCLKHLCAKAVLKGKKKEKKIFLVEKLKKKIFSKILKNFFYFYKSVLKIQRNYRKYKWKVQSKLQKHQQKQLKNAIETIQKHLKGYLSRQSHLILKKNQAATKIQKAYKSYKKRKYEEAYFIINESAKMIQRNYRRYKAYRKYQMRLRIQTQETERKKRLERLRKEQEIKGLRASERLHDSHGQLRPGSLKCRQGTLIEKPKKNSQKMKKTPKNKAYKCETSLIDDHDSSTFRPESLNSRYKQRSPLDTYGII